MKTRNILFLISFTITGFLLFSGNSYAQHKTDDNSKSMKTITIHVTKEDNGNTVVIDTTVVTDGEFNADAFLEEKGVLNDIPESGDNIEKNIIISRPRHQEMSWNNSDQEEPDTIFRNNDTIILFSDKFDMAVPNSHHQGSSDHFDFEMPDDFSPVQSPHFEDMMEGMLRSFGLENVMPFGEMKQVVVKKKRNGKKVIITFEDRKGYSEEHEHGNKKEHKVIILKDGEQGMAPQNEERVIINGQPSENIVIHKNVKKTKNGDQVIINEEVDKPAPSKKETKVIIIKEDGPK